MIVHPRPKRTKEKLSSTQANSLPQDKDLEGTKLGVVASYLLKKVVLVERISEFCFFFFFGSFFVNIGSKEEERQTR